MKTLIINTIIRSLAAVIIGGLIGSERARHGRAAGMRTHILVCLGSCMTSMTSMYVSQAFGVGDVLRLPAQVISGIGFLGAGMIILKPNNVITGLTTAAGVWTTATIGIALGYGYYIGALIVTVLFLATIILFAKFERHRKSAEVIYIELDNLYKVNATLAELEKYIPEAFSYQIFAPKSNHSGNVGINLVIDKRIDLDISRLTEIENVVFAIEE
ncbi:MAG: MgtC/SapB family protein [Acutalibacteraceae bacterium]|nr:MgtC/SapB family protein [Acutalibacteraceae bacterium]